MREWSNLCYLLLQVRNSDDPMRQQEVQCFRRALGCRQQQIRVLDLIQHTPTREQLQAVDVVLMGGSGDYSVVDGGDWLNATLAAVAELYHLKKPTFASCWGFQAMALALGGEVVTDASRAELGNFDIHVTEAGAADPVFGSLDPKFSAFEGHQDIVTRLPEGAHLLAVSDSGIYQAFTFPDSPIYCTQFHPELDRQSYLERVIQYPQYLESLLGISIEAFVAQCTETPEANKLLNQFVRHVSTVKTPSGASASEPAS